LGLVEHEGNRLKHFINIVFLAVSLYSASTTEYRLAEISFFDRFLINALAPIQKGLSSTKDYISSGIEHYLLNVTASRENIKLKRDYSELESELFKIREIEKENRRLKALLEFNSEIPLKKVLAEVVAWDASSEFKVIRINKGSKSGLRLQSTVITTQGLVGYVYRLTDNFADVLTILDRNNKVDAVLERIRAHGIVEGYSQDKCIMKYVGRKDPVVLEDILITSGLGNVYPKGIKIGTVSRIERESFGITQYIEVKPSVDFSRLEEVVVLLSLDDKTLDQEWNVLNKTK